MIGEATVWKNETAHSRKDATQLQAINLHTRMYVYNGGQKGSHHCKSGVMVANVGHAYGSVNIYIYVM